MDHIDIDDGVVGIRCQVQLLTRDINLKRILDVFVTFLKILFQWRSSLQFFQHLFLI